MNEHRNPFAGVTDYLGELGRLRATGTHGHAHEDEARERTQASAWVPSTDVLAVEDDLVVRFELPGVAPDDVDLRFHRGTLSVSGRRRSPEDERAEYLVRERAHGWFRRSLALPEGTRESDVTARFGRGLVEVTVRGGAADNPGARIVLADESGDVTTRTLGS